MKHSFFSKANCLVSKYVTLIKQIFNFKLSANYFQNLKIVSLNFVIFSIVSLMLTGIPATNAAEPLWTTDTSISQVEGLSRVGPNDPVTGYPLWYEDKNGLKLGLCTDAAFCFLETPDPLQPLLWPTNYPDEVFFFAAESLMLGSPDSGVRAIVGMAIEGAFMNDVVAEGDNIVFSRVRIRIDNLVEGRQYKVTYPYGVHVFVAGQDAGPGAVAGPGLSMVRDLGISSNLEFTGTLNGDIGPFLTTTTPPAAGFISPDLNGQPVTGSPLGTNFFRIEGTGVGLAYGPEFECAASLGPDPVSLDDCIQSDLFSVMGQIATRMGVKPTRATFSKEIDPVINAERTFVNIWASSSEGQILVGSVDGSVPQTLTEGQSGNYFLRVEVPNSPINEHPMTAELVNTSDFPPTGHNISITDSVNITSAIYTVGQGLEVTTESSNHVDVSGGVALLVNETDNTRSASLGDAGNGVSSGTYIATADEVGPLKVVVTSKWGGSAESFVKIAGSATGGAQVNLLVANAGPDQSVLGDGTTVNLNGADSLGPLNMTYSWAHDDVTGLISFVDPQTAQATFNTPTTPILGGILTVNFTLTVSDGVNTSTDVVTVNITQPSALPEDSCNITTSLYLEDKEKWKVEGTCVILDNQVVEVYLGDDITPLIYIGQTNVDGIGEWSVKTENGSAATDGSIPDPGTHPRVYVISARGGNSASSDYIIK